MPHTHHQAACGDITTRSAAAPHSAKQASPLECYVCVIFCGPAGFGSPFQFDFFRARSRDVAKDAFAAEWWQKIVNYENGRCFVLNRADEALP